MTNINRRVGTRIRQIRQSQGISQEELAARAELHRAYVGQVERWEKNIGLRNLEKLAIALKVDIRDLFVP